MELIGAYNDPLALNIKTQTRILLANLPAGSPYSAGLLSSSRRELLATLSSLLAVPSLTLVVASAFRPLLIPICALWLAEEENVEEKLVALGLLIQPHEELFPILSRFLRKAALHKGPLAFVLASQSLQDIDGSRLHRLLLAYYRILLANRTLPDTLSWSLSALSTLFWTPHPDTGVRLLAIRCYAIQSGMGEAEREKLEIEIVGPIWGVDCRIDYGQDIHGGRKEVDCWIMPALEAKRIIDARNALLLEAQKYFVFENGDETQPFQMADISPLVLNFHGIMLLGSGSGPSQVPLEIVHTPTIVRSQRSLASHLSLRLPTLITSPPSSGKSLLLSHLASCLYPGVTTQIITINLADTSLDPRSLLGVYVSSPTEPGTFDWKEGTLVRAMREGKWVVFKDIDRGSSEVLSVIKPIVESLGAGKWIGGVASLTVPGRGRVDAHEDFAVFATRLLIPSRDGEPVPPTFFGANKFHEIVIEPPTLTELKAIILSKFPLLGDQVADVVVCLWDDVRAHRPMTSTRAAGYRELERFCARVEHLFKSSRYSSNVSTCDDEPLSLQKLLPNSTIREEIYLEARDVFFGAGAPTTSTRAHFEAIAATIAEYLGLEPDRRDWILYRRIPDFHVEKDTDGKTTALRIGRTTLLAKPTKREITLSVAKPFALHRPAVLLLSRIATALSFNEPILLTGETGTGKTSVVTHIASILNQSLISLNLSHQTESSDLIGGFKPVDTRVPATQLQERFLDLFGTTFSRRKNAKFEESVRKAVIDCKWKRLVGLWRESVRLAKDRLQAKQAEQLQYPSEAIGDPDTPRKRRKTDGNGFVASEARWSAFEQDVNEFDVQHVQGKGKFVFGFVDGPLVKALRSGHWILLDEINLASAETLECISGLLRGPHATITLTEQGSLEPIPRHPDFRMFACMNPATDVGKKDLPGNIRCRFTEIDVPPPDNDQETLLSIITQYIGHNAVSDKAAILNVAEFYLALKKLVQERRIADGSNQTPHYSIRTLTRALTFAADMASIFGLRRSLWEGCLMAFTMVLDTASAEIVTDMARQYILAGVRNPRSLLSREPSAPRSQPIDDFVKFGHFYLAKGPLPEDPVESYIVTPSVEKKLIDLARIMVTRRYPVLIEGPTSSGKTSSVEYLARRTGHRFIRINNHEHTDIQEYLGSYVSDPATGKLVFKDGLLVRALREGHWIVLDELNLAPTDVLEALNRLLDDNRELVIPETQEVVHPHPHFMLFATQNPPGLYAGRKVLSRAFRSRFLEVHFQDVPQVELEYILCQKCQIAPSYASKIVNVFRELQKRRQSSRVFESRHSFATLRDLFRWAGRDAVGYQELAENGYMLLTERTRREDDKQTVKEIIEQEMKVKIDENTIYNIHKAEFDYPAYLGCAVPSPPHLVWTSAMQRLFTLVARALRSNEPVLLVGETGSGKTSVCQIYADAVARRLHSLNCHQNTETADLIGGLRPVRNRTARHSEVLREVYSTLIQIGVRDVPVDEVSLLSSVEKILETSTNLSDESRASLEECRRKLSHSNAIFEWRDGPLVEAMRLGEVFLIDEISLADDSVLERLNSVLEPARTIVLAERGGDDIDHAIVHSLDAFKIVATMNPGGDYGKKELSPALRNRFTEIWVPPIHERVDLGLIISGSWKHSALFPYTSRILDFVDWLADRVDDQSVLGLRDILAWVNFSNSMFCHEGQINHMSPDCIFHHAACMTVLDGLSTLPQLASYSPQALLCLKKDAFSKLQELAPHGDAEMSLACPPALSVTDYVAFGPFNISRGREHITLSDFDFQAPTTLRNALRVARACQLPKAILLEGSPGVGKTSLITALAQICGHALYRINLSDQTDLADLFGSDLPVEGGQPGEFGWKDAEFLKAMQEGQWVLLDEMNLAPQAILEGLNAVLDHRGVVFVPELGRSFSRHPAFRIFAAQNPLHQGGGRKGLPKSFMNRFTKVYLDDLSPDDLVLVCRRLFPSCEEATLRAMVTFNNRLHQEIVNKTSFARDGSPWEFNLRDVIRWCRLICAKRPPLHPADYLGTVYLHRFRTVADREHARLIFEQVFSTSTSQLLRSPSPSVTSLHLRIGHFHTSRQNLTCLDRPGRLLQMQLPTLEAIGHCLTQSWLAIITGPSDCGKTELVRTLAHLTGNALQEISINNATDTMDILGSFEQIHNHGRVLEIARQVFTLVSDYSRTAFGSRTCRSEAVALLKDASQRSIPADSSPNLLRAAAEVLMEPMSLDEALSIRRENLLNRVQAMVATTQEVGQFEWVDGPLVRAIRHGHWALLDGANLCNPSVLDRLNSLCEPDGRLVLSERGVVGGEIQSLKPHPNFRLFMTIDPKYGELSRAMRNRGIEIALLGDPTSEDCIRLRDHNRLPTILSTHGDLRALVVQFDSLRRGLTSQNVQLLTSHSPWPSGLLLDQDSGLSCLIEQTSPLFCCPAPSPLVDPLLKVFARIPAPKYLPLLERILRVETSDKSVSQVQGLLPAILPKFFSMTGGIREAYGRTQSLPATFISTQPADVFLNCAPCSNCMLDPDCPSSHRLIIDVLNLSVALYRYEEELNNLVASDNKGQPGMIGEDGSGTKIVKTVEMALGAVQKTCFVLLELLDLSALAPTVRDLELATTLLDYSRYFCTVTGQGLFNYSAVRAITKRTVKALQDPSSHFIKLRDRFSILEDMICLSTGFGLNEIWSTLSGEGRIRPLIPDLNRLDVLACNIRPSEDQPHLRRFVFDLMVLCSLATTNVEQQQVQETLTDVTKQLTSGDAKCVVNQENGQIEASHLLGELIVLSGLGGSTRMEISKLHGRYIQDIIETALRNTRCRILRFATYQKLIRSQDLATAATISQCQIQWMSTLWNLENSIEGPSILLGPSHLQATLLKCDWGRHSLASVKDYEGNLTCHSEITTILSQTTSSRVRQVMSLLQRSIMMIISCFSSSLDLPHRDFEQRTHDLRFGEASSTHRIVSLLESFTDKPLLDASREFLHPALLRLLDDSGSRDRLIANLGHCWMALSGLLLELYVPNIPIDPAAIRHYDLELGRRQESILSSEIMLHSQIEQRISGNTENPIISYLKTRLHEVSRVLVDVPFSFQETRNASRLRMFWQEVLEFQSRVIPSSRMDTLSRDLGAYDNNAHDREEAVQQAISGFIQRLDALYPEFSDINSPLQLSLLYLKFGLRLVAHASLSSANTNSKALASHAMALVTFPSIRSSSNLLTNPEDIRPPVMVTSRHILLKLAALSFEVSIGINLEDHIYAIDTTYEQLLRLWLIDRARNNDMEAASQSLYKNKVFDHIGTEDVEAEEREFLALFPQFECVFQEEIQPQPPGTYPPSLLVDHIQTQILVDIHRRLMDTSIQANHAPYFSKTFNNMRRAEVEELLNTHMASLSDAIDQESHVFQLALIHDCLSKLRETSNPAKKSYNFYVDANVSELRKAGVAVESLDKRLDGLIQEWPDHMVLQQMKTRSRAILNLDLLSPIAKMLTALEQLLTQSEDWEKFANTKNSLKPYLQAVVGLIVDWRRLELSSWQDLLQTEAKAIADGASEWWFHLYDSTIRRTLDILKHPNTEKADNIATHLSELCPLLDGFMHSSPLGQFHSRLQLLRTFSKYVGTLALSKSVHIRSGLHRIERVLNATAQFYEQFDLSISSQLAQQRTTIENDLRGFIKLASWRDTNVYSLRQSAQRTHRQLYKCVRRFRNVMRQPVLRWLQPEQNAFIESHVIMTSDELVPTPTTAPFPNKNFIGTPRDHLLNLERTYEKFVALITGPIRSAVRSHDTGRMDDFAVEIISTTKMLSALAIPFDESADKKEKLRKSRLMRKRRAWSDLLKELKRAGFAANMKSNHLDHLRDVCWIREQPISTDLPRRSAPVVKSETYLCRLYALLPHLRDSLADHHSDLTTRELQRGVNFTESGFGMALDTKSCLITTLTNFHKLENASRRLRMVLLSSGTPRTSPGLLTYVARIRSAVCKFANALDEIMHGLHMNNNLDINGVAPPSILERISAISAKTITLCAQISTVLDNMKLTGVSFLLRSEEVAVQEILQHFNDSLESLHQLSEQEHRFAYLFLPVQDWLAMQEASWPSVETESTRFPNNDTDTIISSLLVNIQNLLAICQNTTGVDLSSDSDSYIRKNDDLICEFTRRLKLNDIFNQINVILPSLILQSQDALQENLTRMLPFLDRYLQLAEEHLTAHGQWMKALCKLDYVLCSVMHTLAKQGFCQPPDSNEPQMGDDTGDGDGGGVGIGEGGGRENISKEIEDESQVEGLQNDETQQQERQDYSKEDDAIEMSEDFSGDMEDIPDNSSQGEDGSDDENQSDLEDQHAKLDSTETSGVDEKLWGDEKTEPGQKDDKINQGGSKQSGKESEVVAKESPLTDENMEKEQQDQEENTDGTLPEISDAIDDDDGDEQHPDAGRAPSDEVIPESDILDLPDDINFDEEKVDQKDSDVDMTDEHQLDSDAENDADDTQTRADHENVEFGEEYQQSTVNEAPQLDEDTQDQDATGHLDVATGQGASSADNPSLRSGGEDTTADQRAEPNVPGNQDPHQRDEPNSQLQSSETIQSMNDVQATETGNHRHSPDISQRGVVPNEQSSTKPPRSLGDVLEPTRRIFEEIQNSKDATDPPRECIENTENKSQVEYLHPNDIDHDMQALGPAGAEQVAKLQDLRIVDDSPDEVGHAMTLDTFLNIEEVETATKKVTNPTETATPHGMYEEIDVEGAIVPHPGRASIDEDALQFPDAQEANADIEMGDHTEDFPDIDVETELRAWQEDGLPLVGADHIWRRYESMTHDLAYALCEQLRLILEPTLATRLKGDYRSGKRLNMKKIIPFIASDYTKDKIWLRRTRPSQREYQVLIALDDSRSMSESHSVHLAYQTLALVSKALGRLEVGDLAVVKFGERMDILHSFDEGPFTDRAGTKVLNAFRFNQTSTNVSSLLDASLRMLEVARDRRSVSSHSVADLWQLEIIISDGICQDHERLRTILRKAEEQRVMIVFIIIDSLSSTTRSSTGATSTVSQNSILSMKQAAYKRVDGRMELQMQRYLDTFPFEYHVVLRNVEALPDVLSATLRQFFERISGQ